MRWPDRGGGDLGGFRAKVNNDIAVATKDVMAGINAVIASFQAGRRQGGRGSGPC